ncbi:MAG: hypothetical protein M3P37_10350 [Actinomycetota bacterium]|nr:hypothetical protein [Actinomycetota bacterium]
MEEPPAQEPPAQELESEPAPEPMASEEEPASPPPGEGARGAEETPGVPAQEEEEVASVPSSLASSLGVAVSDATETLTGAIAGAFEALADGPIPGLTDGELWGPVVAAMNDLLFGGRSDRDASDGVLGGVIMPASGSQSPSEDAPHPMPVGAPPVGASQASSSSGGGISTGGGVPLLLLCVLASVALLARREGRLSCLHFLLPKPCSAPRRALERPG